MSKKESVVIFEIHQKESLNWKIKQWFMKQFERKIFIKNALNNFSAAVKVDQLENWGSEVYAEECLASELNNPRQSVLKEDLIIILQRTSE